MTRTPLCRCSARRLEETRLYQYRREHFLLAHPWFNVAMKSEGLSDGDLGPSAGTGAEAGRLKASGWPFRPRR